MMETLFIARKEALERVGIKVSLKRLLGMYQIGGDIVDE